MRRFYIDPKLISGNEVLIDGPDSRHIRTVLRMKPGDPLLLLDGEGGEYTASILAFESENVRVSVKERLFSDTESPVLITIAQGFLKDKKMDSLIRQLTELGITGWVPFFAERSVSRPNSKRLQGRFQRWEKITQEAIKQCRRSRALEIYPVLSYEEMLRKGASADVKVIFWEDEAGGDAHFADIKMHSPDSDVKSVFAVFGPEGGFSAPEIEMARSFGFKSSGLGPRILKAETAAIAGAALLQFFFGDMGKKRLT